MTGAAEPWAANNILPNTSTCDSAGTEVYISGSVAYVGGEGAQPGCYDGDFAANVSAGTLVWNSPCEGATQSLVVVAGVLYKGSHMHDCSDDPGGAFGGFTGALARSFFVVTDADSGTMSYVLYRGSSAVSTFSAESWPWVQPTLRFVDKGLSPGTAYRYAYTASDGTTVTGKSPTSAAVSSLANVPDYQTGVSARSPSLDWRLDDTGSQAGDASGNGKVGDFTGGVTTGAAGAISGDSAVSLDGSSGYVASDAPLSSTSTFTESAWFNTSTLSGGDILGTSSNHTGSGGTSDDAVWMDDDGQVVFAIDTPPGTFHGFPGFTNMTARSPHSYNDGHWHQVVATYDATTMSLYVDGSLTSSAAASATSPFGGYMRAGYDDLAIFAHVFGTPSGPSTAPNSYFLQGSLDELAIYPTVLSAAQVANQFGSGGTAP